MERITWGRMQNPLRGVLHGSAALVALVGLVALVAQARGDLTMTVGAALFGTALVAMFSVSALYHSLPWTDRWRERMQRADHSLIFLVVAATFTPLALAALRGISLVVAMSIVWGIALVGIALKLILPHPRTVLSVSLQMAMGWSALLWLPWFVSGLGWEAVALILAGGACYSVGTVVYALRRPLLFPRIFSYHELFHVLVIGGAAFHYWAIAVYAV